ncbi:tetratricopeptide repeat protein [Chitinophaga sp. SYP-B3965]|uniref:tetratricopeptide repeat protein n=1 Tax=Chitinophaga sp. SYP-B3965 TaxID=2663120 RepID=UPI001299FDF7|nr:tetratricopeptide repeat protein [Chitinophaga sp. SYP-B3965]MRG43492.1 tetratricopeptide repeat protein [Chitinophaga sp. SYP-B3965]
MEGRFFTQEQFIKQFSEEVLWAAAVYDRLIKSGFQEYALGEFDFLFVADQREKLEKLSAFLTNTYGLKIGEIGEKEGLLGFTGISPMFPIDQDNLLAWGIDLYFKGFEFDCKLDGYGTFASPDNKEFPNLELSQLAYYFDLGISSYNNRNYGASIIHFTSAIKIFPENPNTWYSRAIAKEAIFLTAKAREDYDKAIELAPTFKEAYINRAVNKSETEDYTSAIEDFNKAIELDANNAPVYFNRGNIKYALGDKDGAIEDWKKAKGLGADYAADRLRELS